MNKMAAIADVQNIGAAPEFSLAGVLDALADSVLVIGPGNRIVYANAAA